ncbi:hypothetical protein Dsin_018100 [Dipteronia sinensis]|uniref:Uncharacterized protein n=1 Tax=Dipteronia sinensis TaxID=43782 RepID=A0AAE0E761_9ROSI|nr:hypothetical protein Dsin_018100 [Dipteronia sinensis]
MLQTMKIHYLPKKILFTTSSGNAYAGSIAFYPGYSRSESPASKLSKDLKQKRIGHLEKIPHMKEMGQQNKTLKARKDPPLSSKPGVIKQKA